MGLPSGLARLAGFSLALWYFSTTVLRDMLPLWIVKHAKVVSVLFTLFVILLDHFVLYPKLYSPLRHLPTVKASALAIITEEPRGATPLKWIKQYPDADMIVVRDYLGISRILLASPAALRDVMSTNTYDFAKPWNTRAFLARVIGFGLILSEGAAHKKQRKALTPAFNIRNIRSLYGMMWNKTNVLLSQLQGEMKSKGQVEMSAWASRLTLDIIGPAALSRDFQSLTNNDDQIADAFAAVLEPSRRMIIFLAINTLFPQAIVKHLPLHGNKVVNENCGFLRTLCKGILDEKHQAIGSEKGSGGKLEEEDDILRKIVQSGEFSDEETIDQMLTFLAAGHETTASALTWSCYMLSQRKHIQSKLRDEIRATIPSLDSSVTHDVLESMPYLNGVCEEVLRLYPTVPTTVREAQRQSILAGTVIPAGTLTLLPIYAVNRNPRFWGPDAEEMVPERWIDVAEDGTQRVNKHGGTQSNFCEITFLHGQRSCIGRDFAKAELRCAIAGIFGKFEVSMVDPNEKITVAGSVTTKPREGMRLDLRTLEGW